MPRILLYFLFLCCFPATLAGQKYLQIEKRGSAKTQKIPVGSTIEYQLKDDEIWYTHAIEDILVEENLLVLRDRYVSPDSITAIRRYRSWTKPARTQGLIFAGAWSGFALIGTATDGDPNSSYRWSDAIVTATAATIALTVPKLLEYKKVKFGKKRRLRLVDLSFRETDY